MTTSTTPVAVTPAAEFYFTRGNVNLVVFPNGWVKNGCDIFDVLNRDTDEFLGSFPLSPVEEVVEGFNRWYATL